MLDSTDIFWIAVKERPDRWGWFVKANVERFPEWRWKRIDGIYAKRLGLKSISGDCESQGHLGCWLSHYMAWQIFLNTEKESAFFFEDDALVLDCFRDVAKEFKGQKGFIHVGADNIGTWAYHLDRETAIEATSRFQKRTTHIDCQIINEFGPFKQSRVACAAHMYFILRSLTSADP